MYTDKFMRVPVEMFLRSEAELTGDIDSSSFPSYAKINPMDIVMYMPTYDEETKPEDCTMIYFRSAESVKVLLPLHIFEKKLDAFMASKINT